jgi:DNA-binding protein YbaB
MTEERERMTAEREWHVEQIAAEYSQHRSDAIEMHRRMLEITAKVTSSKGLVTIEMNAQNDITSMTFKSRAYREMAPAELANAILDTIRRARESIRKQMLEALPSTSFAGTSMADLLDGDVDFASLLPAELSTEGLPFFPPGPWRNGPPSTDNG